MQGLTDSPAARPAAPGEDSPRKALWIRGAFMLFFLAAFWLAQTVLGLVALIQFATLLLAGAPNRFLQDFGRSLAIWLAQVCAFQAAATEARPFPFAPWPRAE